MKVILVGPGLERDRLRPGLQHVAEIIAEHATMADARADEPAADAIVVATRSSRRMDGQHAEVEALTAREIEVLELLAEGLPNKAIAARLGISDQTVKFHVSAISGKLGASNRTDAVRRAVRRGLITL
jgi:DNA-binding NarL/FixJ family response regulator